MMLVNGFLLQLLLGTWITVKLAVCALVFGLTFGLLIACMESLSSSFFRYFAKTFIFVFRGLPELLVLFFMYFGLSVLLSKIFDRYVDINPFIAGVIALGLIFSAYASQVFRSAFLAIDHGQLDAGKALGFTRMQIFMRIEVPQSWRHAIPGLGNLWLVLLKDTAIVTLIGLTDLMNQAKIAASTTREPFTYYLIAALIYLVITSISQKIIRSFTLYENRYIHT